MLRKWGPGTSVASVALGHDEIHIMSTASWKEWKSSCLMMSCPSHIVDIQLEHGNVYLTRLLLLKLFVHCMDLSGNRYFQISTKPLRT